MKITVGIPFFNAEKYLLDAIKSVFAQTHQEWELILVDDGSSDRSLQIAESVRDPRVKVISDGYNRKLATRLNQITQIANCDIIARMDADDLMATDRLEKQLALLTARPDLDFVSSGLLSIDAEDRPVGKRWHFDTAVKRKHLTAKRGAGIVHAAVMARRSWMLEHPYDQNVAIAQDYDLWMRASRSQDLKVEIIPEALYYVRELDSVTPEKLFRSYQVDRRTLWKYRRNLWEARHILKSIAKSMVLNGIIASGRFDALIRRRSSGTLEQYLIDQFEQDLDKIRSVELIGPDEN